jgi:glycosyltransferase involved in cell wall biosynthesis
MATAAVSPKTVIAAVPPLVAGAAHFNAAFVDALAARGPVQLIGWRRLYPPLLYRGPLEDAARPPATVRPELYLDWHDPLSWRRAVRSAASLRSHALVLPWLHPVSAFPYAYLLRNAPRAAKRVVICHNVEPHERVPGWRGLTRAVLRHADLLVVHAPQQRRELELLGLGSSRILEAFHPRFVADELAPRRTEREIEAERARQGDPDLSLLTFGAIRPYKGVDVALDALALLDPGLRVRLTVAGRFWNGGQPLREQVGRLGLEGRVELRDGYVPDREAALLFAAADAALLPYRSASQSGVVQLSFAYGRPVIATRVGGLPAAVADGRDGILCEPDDPVALAAAIERMAREHRELEAGVRIDAEERSFRRYCELLDEALVELVR